jgi:hypothetical protein
VRKKVSASSVDPAMAELNACLGEARVAMEQAAEASSEAWDATQREANQAFDKLRVQAGKAAGKLQQELGIDLT